MPRRVSARMRRGECIFNFERSGRRLGTSTQNGEALMSFRLFTLYISSLVAVFGIAFSASAEPMFMGMSVTSSPITGRED